MKGLKLWYYKKFKKQDLLKIHIFGDDKRIKTHYVIYESNTISLPNREEAYKLETDKIYYQGGFATVIFQENEPIGFNIKEGNNVSEITAKDLFAGLEQKIVQKIIQGAKGDDGFKNILLFGTVALVAVMGIGFYYLYNQITILQTTFAEYDEIMQAIRQALLQGTDGGLGGFN